MSAIDVELRSPVQAHGEEISIIAIAEPKGGDLIAAGHPMSFKNTGDGEPVMTINNKSIGILISRLGKVPMSTVNSLTAKDFQACSEAVMSFLGESD